MNIDSLTKLYVHELKDVYSVESQILDAMPGVIDKVKDDELAKSLRDHLGETEKHRDRITTIFESLDFRPGGHRCKGIAGIIEEGLESIGEVDDEDVVDAAIIAACQRIEHYELAAYGVARAFAEKLGRQDDADLLTKSLDEEGAADRSLTRLAEQRINFIARMT